MMSVVVIILSAENVFTSFQQYYGNLHIYQNDVKLFCRLGEPC